MDTLEPLPKKPPPDHLLSIILRDASPEEINLMLMAYQIHQAKIGQLKKRECELLGELRRLTSCHEELVRAGGRLGSWEASIDCMDDLLSALARNCAAENQELKLLWYVLDHFVPPLRVVKLGLMLYPIPISTLGFHLDVLPLLEKRQRRK